MTSIDSTFQPEASHVAGSTTGGRSVGSAKTSSILPTLGIRKIKEKIKNRRKSSNKPISIEISHVDDNVSVIEEHCGDVKDGKFNSEYVDRNSVLPTQLRLGQQNPQDMRSKHNPSADSCNHHGQSVEIYSTCHEAKCAISNDSKTTKELLHPQNLTEESDQNKSNDSDNLDFLEFLSYVKGDKENYKKNSSENIRINLKENDITNYGCTDRVDMKHTMQSGSAEKENSDIHSHQETMSNPILCSCSQKNDNCIKDMSVINSNTHVLLPVTITSTQRVKSSTMTERVCMEKEFSTTISGVDSMSKFSSISGPSPIKICNHNSEKYFDIDLSIDTRGSNTDESGTDCISSIEIQQKHVCQITSDVNNDSDMPNDTKFEKKEVSIHGTEINSNVIDMKHTCHLNGNRDHCNINKQSSTDIVRYQGSFDRYNLVIGDNDEKNICGDMHNDQSSNHYIHPRSTSYDGVKSKALEETDLYLDEYPLIIDEGNDKTCCDLHEKIELKDTSPLSTAVYDATTSQSFSQLKGTSILRANIDPRVTSHSTVSAKESMTNFSSISGPPPVKFEGPQSSDCFNFDVSGIDDSFKDLKASNICIDESEISSSCYDDDVNVCNGYGVDKIVEDATSRVGHSKCSLDDIGSDIAIAVPESLSHEGISNIPIRLQHQTPQQRSTRRCTTTINQSSKQSKIKHPSSIRSSRKPNRNHKISTRTSLLNQEYNVDHSCSTALERLVRDIGSTFRQWHVHQGCDRHVPLDWMDRVAAMKEVLESKQECIDEDSHNHKNEAKIEMEVEKKRTAVAFETEFNSYPVLSKETCMNICANRSRSTNQRVGDTTQGSIHSCDPSPLLLKSPQCQQHTKLNAQTGFQSTSNSKKNDFVDCSQGAQCIRTKKLLFETVGYAQHRTEATFGENHREVAQSRRQYSIPLILSLWDAPSFHSVTCACLKETEVPYEDNPLSSMEETKIDMIKYHRACDIPLSLQPDPSYSAFSLLGKNGIASPCGNKRQFSHDSSFSNHIVALETGAKNDSSNQGFNNSFHLLETGLGRDISSLFNIGQHITLSLDLESLPSPTRCRRNKSPEQDIHSMYCDVYSYISDTIKSANEERCAAARTRRCRRQKDSEKLLGERKFLHKVQKGSSRPLHGRLSSSSGNEKLDETGDEDRDEKKTNATSYIEFKRKSTRKGIAVVCDGTIGEDGFGSFDSENADSDHESLMMLEKEEVQLNDREIHIEVTASLSSLLQSALNLAATENDCCIPVFGLWGGYNGCFRDKKLYDDSNEIDACAAPSWIPLSRKSQDDLSKQMNEKFILSSPIFMGTCRMKTFHSTHRVYSVSNRILPIHLSTLHGLSTVLLSQCLSRSDQRVMVTAAKHCYYSEHSLENDTDQKWRLTSSSTDENTSQVVKRYKEECRRQALLILERASSPWLHKSIPMWGPSEGSPLVSLSASVSWGVIPLSIFSTESFDCLRHFSPTPPALLQLPLRIRSSNFIPSFNELLDMEYALQRAVFNPLSVSDEDDSGPRDPIFYASVRFNMNAPSATLSANLRCVFAALLRCGSLELNTLPGHLTKKDVLSRLTNSEIILRSALKHVGPVTLGLVDAMDWADADRMSLNTGFDRDIAFVLQEMVVGGLYPTPPEEVFALEDVPQCISISEALNDHPQYKASPPGRLLSILFAHMSRYRCPSSMMRLWLAFVEELRLRWDNNESLPNLCYVPGLDENTDILYDHIGMYNIDHRVLGHRAHLAAFVNSSEPDPSRQHCIIHQKLQVFNICIECKMSTEALNQKAILDDTVEDNSADSEKGSSDQDEFFDPEDDSFGSDAGENQSDEIENMLKLQATMPTPNHNRLGARCPIPDGVSLIATGDQVYAPYLQRTIPMTDEEEEKLKKIFAVGNKVHSHKRISVQSRISVSQRLQKPKLLSDMSAFKAANPGAVFDDFISWYGNPHNPLCEGPNGETVRQAFEYRLKLQPEEARVMALEEASEAIAILMSLRAFWEDTWDEAEPCPAFQQEPLFDPYFTVENLLHSFETIHPSLLMGQILAVNFESAIFVLDSAAKPVKEVSSIKRLLSRVKRIIHDAINMLTKDASEGYIHVANEMPEKETSPLLHVSNLTIQRCEEACDAIAEMEVFLSQALALWQYLPGECNLVNSLLESKEGSFVFLKHPRERAAFLEAIKHHQSDHLNLKLESSHHPLAAMREYVIRNYDSDNPCQLSARLVPDVKVSTHPSSFYGSLLLAITKSSRD